jgi:hypothetical protein
MQMDNTTFFVDQRKPSIATAAVCLLAVAIDGVLRRGVFEQTL